MTLNHRASHSAHRKAPHTVACLGWLLLHVGCAVDDDIVARRLSATLTGGNGGGGPTAGAAGGMTAGAGGMTAGAGGMTAGSGGGETGTCLAAPTLSVAQSKGPVCSGWAARRSFPQALCSCGDVTVPNGLASEASDSSLRDGPDPRGSAAVSISGNGVGVQRLSVEGSLTIAGDSPLAVGAFNVAGDVRLAGPAASAGPILVDRDAWLLGKAESLALIYIERDLHLGPSGSVASFGPVVFLGQSVQEPFEIAPPCPCSAEELLDVAGIVQQGMAENDNARVGLALDALDVSGTAMALTLDCGRYALRRVAPGRAVALRITGKVALFVDAGVELGADFRLELGPGAELDWFVRGPLSIAPGARLGDSYRPGALRLYATEPGSLSLPGNREVALNLYAPRMDVEVAGAGDVHGSLFAATVTVEDSLTLHYDRAVAYADADCTLPPAATCTACAQCSAGLTCVNGSCSACASDADCCFPLVCAEGACVPLATD